VTGAILKETAMSDASQSKTGVEIKPRAKDQSAGETSASPDAQKRFSERQSAYEHSRAEKIAKPGKGAAGSALPEAAELSQPMVRITEKRRELAAEFLERQAPEKGVGMANPMAISVPFLEMTASLISDPWRLVRAQLSLWNDYLTLWWRTTQRFLGAATEPVIEAPAGDRRFRDTAWTDNTFFDFIKQSYLLTARWLQGAVGEAEGIDERTARKIYFYTRQFVDATAPSNFLMTNPEVLRETIESRGENLLNGLQNLLDDLKRGNGRLAIKITDMEAFRIGENIAVTPGKVDRVVALDGHISERASEKRASQAIADHVCAALAGRLLDRRECVERPLQHVIGEGLGGEPLVGIDPGDHKHRMALRYHPANEGVTWSKI
jgi:hypothetical protein